MNDIPIINLIDGLNISPIPLEASQTITTTKWLMAIQAKLNEVILIRNEAVNDANSYTDLTVNKLQKTIDDLAKLFNNGHTILNGSIGLEKMKNDFFLKVNDIVLNTVRDIAKVVQFGINDKGYFYANIPQSWNNIIFDTDVNGRLILKY